MSCDKPISGISSRVLSTDLDDTFIPLPGHADNQADLERIRTARESRPFGLVYATGRHLESVLDAMETHTLPRPDWIVCDVGTSIYRNDQNAFRRFTPYEDLLAEQTRGTDRAAVESLLAGLDGLKLQPPERQQRFKISYFSAAAQTQQLATHINQRLADAHISYACLPSLDSHTGDGLLDVLPIGASKAAALLWLAAHADFTADEVVFAGDSGNDYAALACGFRAIVVANAAPSLADRVEHELSSRGLADRLFRATLPATSGVLEGCRHFGLIPDSA